MNSNIISIAKLPTPIRHDTIEAMVQSPVHTFMDNEERKGEYDNDENSQNQESDNENDQSGAKTAKMKQNKSKILPESRFGTLKTMPFQILGNTQYVHYLLQSLRRILFKIILILFDQKTLEN